MDPLQTISREVGYNRHMALNQIQKEILIGVLLGDGYIEPKDSIYYRLQFKQADRKRDYISWLYGHFSELVRTSPKQRSDTLQWYFSTRSLSDLIEWRELFYKERRKTVPENISELLISPISLAVWYMDDGSMNYREKSHYSFTLSTDAFTIEEVEMLRKALLDNFGIRSSIQTPSSRGKKYTKLYIGKDGRELFLKTITPHILPCFAYKMPPRNNLTPQRLILTTSLEDVRR
jgi:recombination protein RecA